MACGYEGTWDCEYWHGRGTEIHEPRFAIEVSAAGNACRFRLDVIHGLGNEANVYFDGTPVNNQIIGKVSHGGQDYSFDLQFNPDDETILGQSTRTRRGKAAPPQPNDMGTITGTKG